MKNLNVLFCLTAVAGPFLFGSMTAASIRSEGSVKTSKVLLANGSTQAIDSVAVIDTTLAIGSYVEINGIQYYRGQEASVVVTGCNQNDSDIVIPSNIICDGKTYPVVGFRDSWQFQNRAFTSITLSDNITSLPENCFRYCQQLTKVVLPKKLQSIGNQCFHGCSSLKTIEFGDQLKIIGDESFRECSSLSTVKFGNQLKTIGRAAFSYCNLQDTVVLPDSLEEIGEACFQNNVNLKKIILPEKLRNISNYCFCGCSSLSTIAFGDQLRTIGSLAFYSCNLQGTLVFPDSLEEIGYESFYNNVNLNKIIFPQKLTSLRNYCFYNCYKLNEIQFKGNTPPEIVEYGIFEGCQTGIWTYVPESSFDIYYQAFYENSNIHNWLTIINGNAPKKIAVTVATPGTLGEEILKQLKTFSRVNELKITGALNDEDFYLIQNRIPNLEAIDMKEVNMTDLPDYFFNNRNKIRAISLPKTLTTIGYYALNQCSSLHSIDLPQTVTSIYPGAFQDCHSLHSIDLPQTVTTIGSNVFCNCSSLDSISLPDNLTNIQSATFANCTSLTKVHLPQNLISIDNSAFANTALTSVKFPEKGQLSSLGYDAFYNCQGLTEITIPASVTYMQIPFSNCQNIKKITCYASVPPTLPNYDDILSGVNKSTCSLYVPSWSINSYKLALGWDVFYNILPADYETDFLNITGPFTLGDTVRLQNKPLVVVQTNGKFKVEGSEAFSMSRYIQNSVVKPSRQWWYNDASVYSSLISESSAMRADTVQICFSTRGNNWMFLSFPFDVKVADITFNNDALFAIRKYDGANRAQGNEENWVEMTNDSVLHAGVGYVIQTNKDIDRVTLTAINNGNKNRLFSGSDLSCQLSEYVSEFAHNRSWNFVGNPYPCFFDLHYLEFSSPITVWDYENGVYLALSPTDDDYIFNPMEAFFVQKPADVDALKFAVGGRQVNTDQRPAPTTSRKFQNTIEKSSRVLYNLKLQGDNQSDRTRVVINPSASEGYEMACDAAKFMTNNSTVAQLFTLDSNGQNYAINERPLGNGIVQLGISIGTKGTYTIGGLKGQNTENDVTLIDKLTNQTVSLGQSDYSFNSETGLFSDRFELHFTNNVTGIDAIATQTQKVEICQNGIRVTCAKGQNVKIFNEAGQLEASFISNGDARTILLSNNIYMVRINGKTYKVEVNNK